MHTRDGWHSTCVCDHATAENGRAALIATDDETMAGREIGKRTARSLANGSDDRSAHESSTRNQLIALGLIVLGLIMLAATVFFTGDACEQRIIVQKLSLLPYTLAAVPPSRG